MAFRFNFRQISTYLPGAYSEILGKFLNRDRSTGQSPHHAGKTICLTGALSPARFSETDAGFNLGMAFATAQVAAPGVYIAMSGQVFDGLKVKKDRAAGKFVAL